MTQLAPRSAMPDPMEEQVLVKLREEIRLAKMQGGGKVQVEVVVEGHRVTRQSWVHGAKWQPAETA